MKVENLINMTNACINKRGESPMKGKLSPLLMLAVVLAILLTPKPVSSPPTTVVGTQPLPSTAAAGTNFNVNVTIADVQNLYGWEINMTFNPIVLNVSDMVEGPFLLDFADLMGVSTWPLGPLIDNDVGWVQMSNSLFPLPDPPDGADGSGVLATITFHVLTNGTVPLHFNETLLNTNVGGLPTPIPHTARDGFFQLPLGDINSDGIVAIRDLRILGKAYGSAFGQPSYNPDADLNKDDLVNRSDLIIVSGNYGRT